MLLNAKAGASSCILLLVWTHYTNFPCYHNITQVLIIIMLWSDRAFVNSTSEKKYAVFVFLCLANSRIMCYNLSVIMSIQVYASD